VYNLRLKYNQLFLTGRIYTLSSKELEIRNKNAFYE